MSNVDTSAERDMCDLSHFVYSTGAIGRLKTLSIQPVVAGDSYQLDLVGAFRLAPFRRGLSVDSCVDIFTFYVPHRHSYGAEFVDMLRDGIPKTGSPALLGTDATQIVVGTPLLERAAFLGTHTNTFVNALPKYIYQGYLRIWNNYFKIPFTGDQTASLASLSLATLRDGMAVSNLETIYTKPLNPATQTQQKYMDMSGNDGIDIIGLNQAYGKLHTQQERDHFMQRYRDVISSFGGTTHYDADQRPHLLMRTNFWASGYDTDGTTQETLGQFSGRVQQPFSHRVPRFYVPEHGAIFTLMCVRFPPISNYEMHPFAGKAALDYYDLACDPALLANSPAVPIPARHIFHNQTNAFDYLMPAGSPYRFHPSHVDFRYTKLKGFPFLGNNPANSESAAYVTPTLYDDCFQTTQLGHWNIQSKMNCTVMRHIPSARDSIMTN